jgi:hypothetical protein
MMVRFAGRRLRPPEYWERELPVLRSTNVTTHVQATSEVQLVHAMALPRLRPPRCLQRPMPQVITVGVVVVVIILISRDQVTYDVTTAITALVGALCAAAGSCGAPPRRRRRR